jgi:hypothetical protein
MEKILSKIKSSIANLLTNAVSWTSVRMVYLLMSLVLFTGWVFGNWDIVGFVIVMLQVGVWTKFCPSKWVFEKLGWKKTEL